ncbi:MAG: PASTA domain-containing protein, partial [Geodermatophilaceae bacterium]|nr:PASTA domain-containing protein [Geodermatophilaceae bacterium]
SEAGFTNVERSNVESDAPPGTVIEVSPAVGTEVAAGELITLAVAVPPPPPATPTTPPTTSAPPTTSEPPTPTTGAPLLGSRR